MHEVDADQVLQLARERGLDWIDREVAARIATGAATALAALCGHARGSGDASGSEFLGELAALAHRDV